ncbi:dolichyl-diphosphooligosaccharide--protein glycosyltransferase subunit 1 [Serendipita sp. 407]|nr:dolichyl-diphosphooligosaccharide--protein glycosyltransferase subunit 1 [Serendipita sp. 397]KAG8836323.1 dolichyl-diphosphooligosaccharide--protein glycosyltransferase subunit 1 [Serendipita sp. 400]KAG9053839.1 dolichyl-diphosphooligosaccharide--protein glycosyltransferase subunit 1 [Serendipita sp. 407]
MRLLQWLLAASSTALTVLAAGPTHNRSFENTNVQRTIELGGSLTHVTTTFAIKALDTTGPNVYTFALSKLDQDKTSLFEVKLKGNTEELKVKKLGFDAKSNAYLYSVDLPPMAENASATLIVNSVLVHASTAHPASVKQEEPQCLIFTTEAYVLSPYPTVSERTKIRLPSPKVVSYSAPKELTKYASSSSDSKEQATGTRSGAVITYGPFQDLPVTAEALFQKEDQKLLTIHYEYDTPILSVVSLDRSAEISHWGNNLNVQDSVHIRNDGPQLKGHFSRLELQQAKYFHKTQPQVLQYITLQLPAGIHNPYYYDSIGNVTTSRYRASPPVKPGQQKSKRSTSFLELRPRFPLLGGWNYTYTLGWDAPLGDSVKYDSKEGKYVIGVPFMTPIPGAAVDDAKVTIVFPEGAENVQVYPPFDVESMTRFTHVTYLDTLGRPAVTLKASKLTDQHTGLIYASYTLPLRSHLAKPLVVATALFGFFLVGMFFRRVDLRISSTPLKSSS